MSYDLADSGLFNEGVHEVLLSVTVEIDELAGEQAVRYTEPGVNVFYVILSTGRP